MECWGANALYLRDYKKGRLGQQFYFDEVSKTIKSQQWRDRSITLRNNGKRLTDLHMTTTNSRWF
jgi:hypothetical protein